MWDINDVNRNIIDKLVENELKAALGLKRSL